MAPSFRLRALLNALLTLAAVAGVSAVARAQDAPPPAYVSRVEGVVTLEHEGQSEPAAANVPLVGGDRLFTANGRAEIMFPDGTSLEVEENSEVDFDSPTRFRVIAGAIERRPAVQAGQPSPYLPENLQTYAPTLDDYGTWEYDQPYGYVWYPTVAAGWRPYYDGYWADLRPYGWTWVGLDVWSWPTHHYGRWGFARNRWFWIPGRTWGPAYVSWGVATDYVSWCPLGPNNAPLFSLAFGVGHTWSGWTFVPRSTFGYRNDYVSRYAVAPGRIARTTPFLEERRLSIPARPFAGRDARARVAPSSERRDTGRSVARPFDGRDARSIEGRPGRALSTVSPRTQAPVAVPRGSTPRTTNPTYRAPVTERQAPASPGRPPTPEYRRSAPGTYPPMGDFRRPPLNPSPDYRRPIQEARPPAPVRRAPSAPEDRAPAGESRAPQAVPRMDRGPAPSMPPHMERGPSAAPRGPAAAPRPGPPARSGGHEGGARRR